MTQSDFFVLFWKLLDQDSPKGSFSMQRTLSDAEAETFSKHLWELFDAGPGINCDETWLCQSLLNTQGKFDSEQDRAAAICRMRK